MPAGAGKTPESILGNLNEVLVDPNDCVLRDVGYVEKLRKLGKELYNDPTYTLRSVTKSGEIKIDCQLGYYEDALDRRTGKTVWQQDAPLIGPDANWEDFGGDPKYAERPDAAKISEMAGSWATPLLVRVGAEDELVVAFALRLMAFAPRTGEPLWNRAGPNIGVYSSPFSGEGIVGLNASGLSNTVMAVRPGGRGDVTATHRQWINYPGHNKTCLGAGVISRGHFYQVNMQGFAQCLDFQTGRTIWEERLTGTGARNASWSAPVLAADLLYVPNQNADVFVLRAGEQFECLATNSIGGEPMNASLAVSEGRIFIRTDRQLWCVAGAGKP